MMKWINAKVIKQQQWAKGLHSIFVEAPIDPFIAGQFAQLAIEQNTIFRPYSFVNAPQDSLLEFYYTHLPDGAFTSQLVKLEPGARIWVTQKGAGKLVLTDVPACEILWLFASGTGLGPFLSMLKTAEPWQRFKHIVLVHSVRYQDELTHATLIQSWQQQYPQQFHWYPVVTREGNQKRITALLQSGQFEQEIGLICSTINSHVMLCGNPHMVHDLNEILKARGLLHHTPRHPGQMSLENYWKI